MLLHPFLRRTAWFLLGLLIVAGLGEAAARITLTATPAAVRWYDEAAQLKIEQMDDLGDVDVVFAGTSMAWQAFVPSVYDEANDTTSYNAGLNGGTPEVMERWLLEEVVPRLHPDTVVWGLSSLDLAPGYGPQQRSTYDEALATRTGLLASIEQAAAGWSALVANRTVLRNVNDVVGSGSDARREAFALADERLGDRGERLDFRIDRGERQRQIIEARLRDFVPSADDAATISRVIDALQADGVEVILVQLPVPGRFIDAHPNGRADYDRVAPALAAIATTAHSRYLRLTAGTVSDDYVDYTHLDAVAAAEFTRRTADAIDSNRDDRGLVTSAGSATATPTTNTGTADCPTEIILDDYGFEIEISTCDPAAESDTGRTDIEIGEPLTLALQARDRACDAGASPGPALEAIAAAVDEITARLDDTDQQTVGVTYSLVEQAALDSGTCHSPSADDETAAAAAAVTGALDRLFALTGVQAQRASAIWQHRDRLAAALWARHAEANRTEIDGLIVGNSVPRTALDPVLLGELTGTTVGQASVSGATPETIGPWIDEIVAATNPATIYWALSYYDLYARCGRVDARVEDSSERAARRAGAFEGIVTTERRARWDHLLGPFGSSSYGSSRILESLDAKHTTSTLGRDVLDVAPRPDLLQSQVETIGTIWFPGEPCLERVPFVVDIVSRLRSAGHEVILVAIPPNPAFAEADPGGIDAYFTATEAIASEAGPDEYVPLDITVSADHFLDGIHLLDGGRRALTEELAAGLDRVSRRPG